MIGIIAAMEKEVDLLRSRLLAPVVHTKGPFTFYQGILEGKKAVILQCGIGKVNAGAGTALLLELYEPTAVINTGTAGGYLDTQKTGDVVVSDRVVHHDADARAFGYAYGQIPKEPLFFLADPSLVTAAKESLQRLKAAGEYEEDTEFHVGLVGSGDQFMTDPEETKRLKVHFPDLAAVEMEGAGIAQICQSFRVPFVIIRAISDKADSDSPLDFPKFVETASRHSALTVLDLLQNWRI